MDDSAHLIQLEHIKETGNRTVLVDGAVQGDVTSTATRDEFTLGNHKLALVTTPVGMS